MNNLYVLLSALAFPIAAMAQSSTLTINEIQVANIDRFLDHSNNYGAWIELYNPSSETITLTGLKLRHTDSDELVETYTLTDNQGTVKSGGFQCLWFDHNSKDGYYGANAKRQIPFELDADGGVIELLDNTGLTIDKVTYPRAIARVSYLRSTDGGDAWSYTSHPTPGASNKYCPLATQRLEAPVVSCEAKVFTEGFDFEVSIPAKCTLYYTLDGSAPEAGKCYISEDGKFSVSSTAIYRFMLAREGYLDSPVVTRSFIENTAGYDLPVVSVSTAPANLFDDKIGVYVYGKNGRTANGSGKAANINMDWERPVNFEYLVPDSTGNYEVMLEQEVSLKVFGGWSRFFNGNDTWEERPSFKLKAEKQYEGLNELSYPFFASKPHIKLKSILVRNGGGNSVKLWDAYQQELALSSGFRIDCQTWQPTQVFLNGQYLGFMNLREESNHRLAYSDYGVESEEIDQWESEFTFNHGDNKKVNTWLTLCTKLGSSPTSTTVWKQIENVLDVDEFCNYFALECYVNNLDWYREEHGNFKNIKGFVPRSDDGKIHFVLFDLDSGFSYANQLQSILATGTSKTAKALISMLKYKPFQKQFIDAFCILGGSIYTPERAIALRQQMGDLTRNAAKLEGLKQTIDTYSLNRMIDDRETTYQNRMQTLADAFGLTDTYTVTLTTPENGHRFLLNGQEIPTGEFDGIMFGPITLTAIAPAGQYFDHWTVDGKKIAADSIFDLSTQYKAGKYQITAQFRPIEDKDGYLLPPVRINEVSAGNDIFINEYGKKADYIELYNTTDQAIDLTGYYLSDNVNKPMKYKISGGERPADATIPAHGYKIVWCDKKEPDTQLHASFKLDNADSCYVLLTAPDGSWSDHLTYKAQSRWKTFGRYPDGADQVALFSYPTIGRANRLGRDTELSIPATLPPSAISAVSSVETDKPTYYNLMGQPLSTSPASGIYIKHGLQGKSVLYTN